MHIISITAHRNLTFNDIPIIHLAMKQVVTKSHVDAIYFGGARGGDTESLRAALKYRVGDRPRLVVVCPDTLGKQPSIAQNVARQADEVIELRNPITKSDGYASYTIRDQYLVDSASTLVAFFSGDYKSGTGKTVRMAEEKGIVVAKIPVQGCSR